MALIAIGGDSQNRYRYEGNMLHGYSRPIVPYVPESPSFVLLTMFFEKEAQKFGNIAGG